MMLRSLAISAANVAVLTATLVALRAWAEARLGSLDLDHLGLTWPFWVPLVVMGGLFAILALRWRWALVGGYAVLIGIGLIVVDHAIGAFRDGHVSPEGRFVGALMVLQVVVLGISLSISGSVQPVARRFAIGTLLAIAASLIVVGGVGTTTARVSRDEVVSNWLDALAGGEEDRGWRYLDPSTRERTTFEAYREAAVETDWASFRWEIEGVHEMDGGVWLATVFVDGGLDSVPRFMLEQRLVHAYCVDASGPGFMVNVTAPLFGMPAISSGGWTGSAERAADLGRCPPVMPAPTSPVRWNDGGSRWTGFTLEVWNRTITDLYVLDEGGRRVDVPACGQVSTSEIDLRQFEIRNAAGYYATIGAGAMAETTHFLVILPMFPETNGVPPAEPLPPCEDPAQIQRGF